MIHFFPSSLNYWLQSSWSSWWQIWWCRGLRCVSRCPTRCASSAPGFALCLRESRWDLPDRTDWTTTPCGCGECCSSPPCNCQWSRKGCSHHCRHLRHWTVPCPGSVPGCSLETHHLHQSTQKSMQTCRRHKITKWTSRRCFNLHFSYFKKITFVLWSLTY